MFRFKRSSFPAPAVDAPRFVRWLHAAMLGALLTCAGAAPAQISADAAHIDLGYSLLELSRRAEQGDSRAAFFIGRRYATGDGVTRDYAEAIQWFTRASDDDLPEAQYWLGIMHAMGHGVDRSEERAVGWFEMAAEQGLADAQHALGTMLLRGNGVPRNVRSAVRWLTEAAEQGVPQAQYNLGVLYEFGKGVSLNLATARQWFQRAYDSGFESAGVRLKSLNDREAAVAAGKAAPAPTRTKPQRPVARAQPLIDPNEALEGLADSEYTLQLVSYRSLGRATSAIKRFKLGVEARVYTSLSRGKTWYVVIYGAYASAESAEKAVARLPVALKKAKPRVRSVASIRRQLREQGQG